ncbi:MAG: aminotransferase class IV [Actinomycetota bacterium]|nr:aminotransferase class IV [Actinomycetota bacterium]
MSSHIFINGKLFTGSRAAVPVKDRGFLYGDGLFETLRSFKGSVFMLDSHLDRLFHSLKILKYDTAFDKEYIKEALKKTIAKNNLNVRDAYIKIIVTRGIHKGELHFKGNFRANLIIIADALDEYPEKDYTEGIKIISSSIRRPSPGNPLYSHKLLNYFENIFAKDEADHNKAQEAIFLTGDHLVLEGASSNIFYVKRNTVYTPPLTQNILPGITRQMVIELCAKKRIKVKQKNIHYRDMINADEVFKTSSIAGIVPVKKIDRFVLTGKVPGCITAELMVSYINKAGSSNLQ